MKKRFGSIKKLHTNEGEKCKSPTLMREKFKNDMVLSKNFILSEHLQTPPKPLILTILANCLPKYIEPNIGLIVTLGYLSVMWTI